VLLPSLFSYLFNLNQWIIKLNFRFPGFTGFNSFQQDGSPFFITMELYQKFLQEVLTTFNKWEEKRSKKSKERPNFTPSSRSTKLCKIPSLSFQNLRPKGHYLSEWWKTLPQSKLKGWLTLLMASLTLNKDRSLTSAAKFSKPSLHHFWSFSFSILVIFFSLLFSFFSAFFQL